MTPPQYSYDVDIRYITLSTTWLLQSARYKLYHLHLRFALQMWIKNSQYFCVLWSDDFWFCFHFIFVDQIFSHEKMVVILHRAALYFLARRFNSELSMLVWRKCYCLSVIVCFFWYISCLNCVRWTILANMQQKYESKVEQGSGWDLKDLTLMREDDIGSALISKEEVREEMKALKAGAHQMERPSPTQTLGVNPFPSRFINRTVPWGGFAR